MRIPIFLLAVLLLGACATQPDGAVTAFDATHLPAVGTLEAQHAASALAQTVQTGVQAARRSSGAGEDGPRLVLQAGPAAMQWGIWSFDPAGEALVGAAVELTEATGPGVFIGLADFTADRWQWSGPFTASQTLILSPAHSGPVTGNFYCAVVAADGAGASVASVTLTTDDGGAGTPVVVGDTAAADEENQEPSMVLINGNPAAAYVDKPNQQVMFVRALDPQGAAWGVPQAVVAFSTPGSDGSGVPDLLVVNGNPTIAYFAEDIDGDFHLGYVRALDANGAAWDTPVLADPANDTGDYPELILVGGNPAIAYYSFADDVVRFVRALDADGATWGTPVTASGLLGMTDFNADCLSVALVDGNPAIAYDQHNADNLDPGDEADDEQLAYVRAGDSLGASWGAPVIVDPDARSGYFADLKVMGGVPVVAYYNFAAGELRFTRASDAQGTDWEDPQVLDTGTRGATLSLQLIDGLPSIAHYDLDDGTLLYIRANDAAGLSWGSSVVLDDAGDTGRYPSMLELPGGGPGVLYQNFTSGQLQYLSGF
jgi:hypothetical protein